MQEHISQQRPRLHQELGQRGRQFQIQQPGSDIPVEEHQKHAHQGSHDKYAYIYIDQLQADTASLKIMFQIRNKTAHCYSFFANAKS